MLETHTRKELWNIFGSFTVNGDNNTAKTCSFKGNYDHENFDL